MNYVQQIEKFNIKGVDLTYDLNSTTGRITPFLIRRFDRTLRFPVFTEPPTSTRTTDVGGPNPLLLTMELAKKRFNATHFLIS